MTKRIRGSVTVEAALVLPIFLIALMPFVLLMKMTLAGAVLETALQDTVTRIATESYLLERIGVVPIKQEQQEEAMVEEGAAMEAELDLLLSKLENFLDPEVWEKRMQSEALDLAGQVYLKQLLTERLSGEDLSRWGIEAIDFTKSRFFYQTGEHGYLIKGVLRVKWAEPFSFWSIPETELIRVAHAFMGENDPSSAKLTEAKEDASEEEQVVYRIGSGTHYHTRNCYLIAKTLVTSSEGEAIARGIPACSRCCPQGISVVYMTDGGECYHTASCPYLFPNVTAMTLQAAETEGLLPCGLCFGEGGYFP